MSIDFIALIFVRLVQRSFYRVLRVSAISKVSIEEERQPLLPRRLLAATSTPIPQQTEFRLVPTMTASDSPERWYNNSEEWHMKLREIRHNPCFMRPISALVLFVVLLFWLIVAALKFPTLILGLVLSPLLSRFHWMIEFWYPTGIGKHLHFWMIRLSQRSRPNKDGGDANRGFHSRCTETRIEMIPQRVYIHPLPQFMDNLGYLVVCLPAATSSKSALTKETTSTGNVLHIDPNANVSGVTQIVAFVVDCGDASAVLQHIQLIRETFYDNSPIHVQSILSTHKHHDHTAGNIDLFNTLKDADEDSEYGAGPIKLIFGGAADKVPGCNYPLANGDKLPLPKAGSNDMSDLIEVEAIATPAHTRGSMAYKVQALIEDGTATDVCIFTGDTIFSGGGGVPFEADIDVAQDESAPKMTANSYIKASAATYAMERCFSEVLFRSISIPTSIMAVSPSSTPGSQIKLDASTRDRVVILPGHEYSQELLSRQLSSSASLPQSPFKWKNFEPALFFDTVSQYYVSIIRRTSLPASSSGKLLLVPTTLSRELSINPHLRSLRQRGMTVIAALKLWNRYFAKVKIVQDVFDHGPAFTNEDAPVSNTLTKSRAQESQWNLNSTDLNRKVFTTVYTSDLDSIIQDLNAGQIDAVSAATKLLDLKAALHKPLVTRRPIPGTLPTSRAVYRGLLGFTLLASAPTALTRSDSQSMKLPEPIVNTSSSDHICISKRRLITALFSLGLLDADDGKFIVAIIQQLWKEVKEVTTSDWNPQLIHNLSANGNGKNNDANEVTVDHNKGDIENASTDAESVPEMASDECELGALKWIIYGIPAQQKPQSWLTKYCMPCSKKDADDNPTNPIHTATRMQRHSGELVRHDVFTCPVCRDATGCRTQQIFSNQIEENNGYVHQITTVGTSSVNQEEQFGDNDDESTTFIEVSTNAILHP
jgi:glyoxylase-like metal-dependent hydrolase (beta-lactamase superfamily II)